MDRTHLVPNDTGGSRTQVSHAAREQPHNHPVSARARLGVQVRPGPGQEHNRLVPVARRRHLQRRAQPGVRATH